MITNLLQVLQRLKLVGQAILGQASVHIVDAPSVLPHSYMGLEHTEVFANSSFVTIKTKPLAQELGAAWLDHADVFEGDEDSKIPLRGITFHSSGVNVSTMVQIEASARVGSVTFTTEAHTWTGPIRQAETAMSSATYESPTDWYGADVVEMRVSLLSPDPVLSSTAVLHIVVRPINDRPSIHLDPKEIHLFSGVNTSVPGLSAIALADSDASSSLYTLLLCVKHGRLNWKSPSPRIEMVNVSCVQIRDGLERLQQVVRSNRLLYTSPEESTVSYLDELDITLIDPDGAAAKARKLLNVEWRGVPMRFIVRPDDIRPVHVVASGAVKLPEITLSGRPSEAVISISMRLSTNMTHLELPPVPDVALLEKSAQLLVLRGTLTALSSVVGSVQHVPLRDWNGLSQIQLDAEDELGKADTLRISVVTTGNKSPVDVDVQEEELKLLTTDLLRVLKIHMHIENGRFVSDTPTLEDPLLFQQSNRTLTMQGRVSALNEAMKSLRVEVEDDTRIEATLQIEDPHVGNSTYQLTLPQSHLRLKVIPPVDLWVASVLQLNVTDVLKLDEHVVEIFHEDPEHYIHLRLLTQGGQLRCATTSESCASIPKGIHLNGTVAHLRKELREVTFHPSMPGLHGDIASITFNASSSLHSIQILVTPPAQEPMVEVSEAFTRVARQGDSFTLDGLRIISTSAITAEVCENVLRLNCTADCGAFLHPGIQPFPAQLLTLYGCVPKLNQLLENLIFVAQKPCLGNLSFTLYRISDGFGSPNVLHNLSVTMLVEERQETPSIIIEGESRLWPVQNTGQIEGLSLGEGSCENLTIAFAARSGTVELPSNCTREGECRGSTDDIDLLLKQSVFYQPKPGVNWDIISIVASCEASTNGRSFANLELEFDVEKTPSLNLSFEEDHIYASGTTRSITLPIQASCSIVAVATDDSIDMLVEASSGKLRVGRLFVWDMLGKVEPAQSLQLRGRCAALAAGLETLMLDVNGTEETIAVDLRWMNKSSQAIVHIAPSLARSHSHLNCSHINLPRTSTLPLHEIPFRTSSCSNVPCTAVLQVDHGMIQRITDKTTGNANSPNNLASSVMPLKFMDTGPIFNFTYIPGKNQYFTDVI